MRLSCRLIGAAALCLAALGGWADVPAPDDAIVALSRSLTAAEQRLGPANPDLLTILAPLARLQYQAADLAGATASRRRALQIAIGAFGSGSVRAAEAMTALAALYLEQQRYLDAEPLLIAAGNVVTSRLGTGSPEMAAVLAGRAQIALARGDRSLAENWAEQAVAIDATDAPEEQSRPLCVLGAALAAAGRFDDSERVLRRALALDRGNAGADGLDAARSLAQLGETYLHWKRYADALPLIEQAARIDQARLGATHPLIADDFFDLGLVYLAMNRAADARTVLRAAVHLLERGAGRGTPRLAHIELALARAEHEMGKEKTAQSLFADARRILNAAEDEERERERQT